MGPGRAHLHSVAAFGGDLVHHGPGFPGPWCLVAIGDIGATTGLRASRHDVGADPPRRDREAGVVPLGVLLDVLLPPACAACGLPGRPACDACLAALAPLPPPWCARVRHPGPGRRRAVRRVPGPNRGGAPGRGLLRAGARHGRGAQGRAPAGARRGAGAGDRGRRGGPAARGGAGAGAAGPAPRTLPGLQPEPADRRRPGTRLGPSGRRRARAVPRGARPARRRRHRARPPGGRGLRARPAATRFRPAPGSWTTSTRPGRPSPTARGPCAPAGRAGSARSASRGSWSPRDEATAVGDVGLPR